MRRFSPFDELQANTFDCSDDYQSCLRIIFEIILGYATCQFVPSELRKHQDFPPS